MRNIAEILTFHTPLDTDEISLQNAKNIREMIEDFLINSGEIFSKNSEKIWFYEKTIYSIKNIAELVFLEKNSENFSEYKEPHLSLVIRFSDTIPKQIWENFLNIIIRFFSGMYKDSYFLDFDKDFAILPMNEGKKYQLSDLEKLDIDRKNSENNKKLLDSLFYLRFELYKHKFLLQNQNLSTENIPENFLYLTGFFEKTELRAQETQKSIEQNIQTLEKQISLILSYFL